MIIDKSISQEKQLARVLLALLVMSSIILIGGSCIKVQAASENEIQVKEDSLAVNQAFSVENLKKEIKKEGIRFERIVLAQAYLETGSFTSNIFLSNNNMFGMKCATRRMTTHQGEQFGHAYFNSWQDCVTDYAYFQRTYAWHIETEEQYFQYLADNYAEDPLYVDKLKVIITQNFN